MPENIYKYPLHSEIIETPTEILVGNSGTRFTKTNPPGLDLLPDNFKPLKILDPETSLRYMYIHAFGLNHLINHLQKQGKLPYEVIGTTNSLIDSICTRSLLNYYVSTQLGSSDQFNYSLYIQALTQDANIIGRLAKLAERCIKKNYNMRWL